jgi:hypothetical protein
VDYLQFLWTKSFSTSLVSRETLLADHPAKRESSLFFVALKGLKPACSDWRILRQAFLRQLCLRSVGTPVKSAS